MKCRMNMVAGLATLVAISGLVGEAQGGGGYYWVTRAGQEEQILALVSPGETGTELLPGAWFERVEVHGDGIVFVVSDRGEDPAAASLVLTWDTPSEELDNPPPWRLTVQGTPGSEAVEDATALLRGRIEERLTPEIYQGLVFRRTGSEPGLVEQEATLYGRLRWHRDHARWRAASLSPDPAATWETFLAGLFFFMGLLLAAVAAREAWRSRREPALRRFLVDAAALTLLALWIRTDLTAPNLLGAAPTDASLDELRSLSRWSASGPPLLLGLCLAMGIPRRAGLLAGIALAAWPLHAAVGASELLLGPALALGLAGLALAFGALRWDREILLVPAAAVLAWVAWSSPVGPLWVIPAVVPAVVIARRWSLRPVAWAAAGWLGFALITRGAGLLTSGAERPGPWGAGGLEMGQAAAAAGLHPVAPWWLWFGVPLGVLALRGRREVASVVGVGLGVAALALLAQGLGGAALPPPLALTGMPWVALLAGLGLAALLARLPWPRFSAALFLLLAAGVIVVPTIHRDWLGTTYSPAASEIAFRRAHRDVSQHCGVVVPAGPATTHRGAAHRYQMIASEESRRIPGTVQGYRVVAAPAFVARARDGSLPQIPTATTWPEEGQGCWFAFTMGAVRAPEGMEYVPLSRYSDDCSLHWVRPASGGEEPPHVGIWDLPRGRSATSSDAPLPAWSLPEVVGMSEALPDYEELRQLGWWHVRFYGPGALPMWLLLLMQLAIGTGFVSLRRGRRQGSVGFLGAPRRHGPVLITAALALGGCAWWWLNSGLPEVTWDRFLPQIYGDENLVFPVREFAVVAVFLAVMLAALLAATGAGLCRLLRPGERRAALETAGLAALVLGLSLVIRVGFTAPNVLTDGGSGHERVLLYGPNYGALSVLISWLLPGQLEARVWPAIRVLTVLAAIGPASLFLLARGAGMGRVAALLSALALACWPLHAALYASDFLNGAVLTLFVSGLAFAFGALRLDRPWLLLPGAALLGFAIWCRPESPIHLLPALLPGIMALRRWGHRFETWAAAGWISMALGALLMSMTARPEIYRALGHIAGPVFPLWESIALAGFTAFPWWLVAGIPLGLIGALRPWTLLALIVLGLGSGFVPVALGGIPEDLLEGFRYGTLMMPWFALLSGAGLSWAVTRIPPGRVRTVAYALVLGAVCVTPIVHRDYLGTAYGSHVSDRTFREALRSIPARCGVVVPGEAREDGLDPAVRFVYIAAEERRLDPSRPPAEHVVGAATFMAAARALEGVPQVTSFYEAEAPGEGEACWYVFLSGECQATQGMDSDPDRFYDPGSCKDLEASLELEPLGTLARGFRYHRLLAVPRVMTPPKHAPDFEVRLFRLRGIGDLGEAPATGGGYHAP